MKALKILGYVFAGAVAVIAMLRAGGGTGRSTRGCRC